MAWYLQFQCCFASKTTQYAVNIYDSESSASTVTQLTGADNPFETSEDYNDNIYTPIRKQSGYLRVLDFDGTLLEQLIPTSNTKRLVRLYEGTYANNTFTPHTLRWQGFLCAQAYTQPWDANTNVIELPVKSVLASLEDSQVPEEDATLLENVAYLLVDAVKSVGLTTGDSTDIVNLCIISDVADAINSLLTPLVQWGIFFSEETVSNEGDSYLQLVGESYYNALSSVLSLYGLQAREDAGSIYLVHYDRRFGALKAQTLAWSYVENIANGASVTVDETSVSDVDMLAQLTFKGTNNVSGFVPGARSVKLSLNCPPINENVISLPLTTEDTSTVVEVEKVANGTVKVQPHSARSLNTESFTFSRYATSTSTPTTSTYANCLNKSVVYTPIVPLTSDDPVIETGAFPVRWSYNSPDDTSTKLLTNGLMINTLWNANDYDASIPSNAVLCYSLRSALSYSHATGYLNIGMDIKCFMQTNAAQASKQLQFGTTGYTYTRRYKMYFKLQWGSRYWNGEEWTNDSTSRFAIETDGTGIVTNKTDDIFSTVDDGFFVPVTESMSGTITLSLVNFGVAKIIYPNEQSEIFVVHSSIISSLRVSYLASFSETASQRTENIYRKTIMVSGFSGDNSVGLSIGTMNNNMESQAFLKSNVSDYIEALTYYTAEGTKVQRPELHLLERMEAHYSGVRRTLTGTVQKGVAIFTRRFIYNSKYYFGIDAKHEWREDRQEIKFLEVANP